MVQSEPSFPSCTLQALQGSQISSADNALLMTMSLLLPMSYCGVMCDVMVWCHSVMCVVMVLCVVCREAFTAWRTLVREATRLWPTAASWTWPRLASMSRLLLAPMRSRLASELSQTRSTFGGLQSCLCCIALYTARLQLLYCLSVFAVLCITSLQRNSFFFDLHVVSWLLRFQTNMCYINPVHCKHILTAARSRQQLVAFWCL